MVKTNGMVWGSKSVSIYQGISVIIGFECEGIELSKNLYECLVWGFFEYVSKWFSNDDVELCEDLTQLCVEGLGNFWLCGSGTHPPFLVKCKVFENVKYPRLMVRIIFTHCPKVQRIIVLILCLLCTK